MDELPGFGVSVRAMTKMILIMTAAGGSLVGSIVVLFEIMAARERKRLKSKIASVGRPPSS
ncbi:hypothetical protein [Bradyrhizobium zhanjiangense]|uniref:Uncharacterized protein n=1 Tax=Bradyrhizobium zhanjiangense TaxID=1325107 RepID=A0A4Q0QDL7_9BRAD|nr:hypothetical protein [Bradyrhizobium zhanjiangense]RXG88723.1 hypothetical protein EAS61_29080 [Bradyrhizobium zhanjiangense]RXG96378.1 hypothetical protein EAS62_12380 [Bradyrhizobium zhanjiangense]